MKREMKRYVRKYFTFTRQETRGTILLVIIILLLVAYRFIHPFLFLPPLNNLNDVQITWINQSKKVVSDSYNFEEQINSDAPKNDFILKPKDSIRTVTYFTFDPNTITLDSLLLLGMSPKKAAVIVKYRNSGGRFKSDSDLKKIYVLSAEDIARLTPWIFIPKEQETITKENAQISHKITPKKIWLVDVNVADSADFVSLSGIGPFLAVRIIKYRDRFGAFRDREQILEVAGITQEWFDHNESRLIASKLPFKKLDINSCTVDELKGHAYFDTNSAKILMNYRKHHGAFKSLEEIKNCAAITDDFFNKILPYITINTP